MRKTFTLLVVAALTLSACGSVRDSRLNPFNWFGQSRSESIERAGNANPLIPQRSALSKPRNRAPLPGPLVQRITALEVDRTPGGAVIRAEGLAAASGAFDVVLVPSETEQAATKSFELRAKVPSRAPRGGPEAARKVIAAASVTNQQLSGVRTIRVIGLENMRSARR
ncbi:MULTISPECIES: hypothetical protein [Sediminimonas]|uniref:hypothetical protein n=1 Tax=Sediminimonas TaxID=659427 RepID=UPI00041EAC4B|nr:MULTISPECIES: hypothetical protein [Sediminimonas]MDR9485416.1 hypothetical protein [Sediminimonas sp.]